MKIQISKKNSLHLHYGENPDGLGIDLGHGAHTLELIPNPLGPDKPRWVALQGTKFGMTEVGLRHHLAARRISLETDK